MNVFKTITIGIPAHNEEKNIAKLLDSILSQKTGIYRIDTIIVLCDGCTDDTAHIVQKYAKKYRTVTLLHDSKRLGKPQRLNQLFKTNVSDIIMIFDGDTLLSNAHVVQEIADNFTNPNIGLVGANDTPYRLGNFVQKIASVWIDVWYQARSNYNNGDTVNNNKGCAFAVSGSLSKQLNIPASIVVGEEDYIYFMAKKLGYGFSYAKNALVYYYLPARFRDFMMQTTRFLSTKDKIAESLGGWVYDEYTIPDIIKIKALCTVFLQEPFYLPLAIGFQCLQRVMKHQYADTYKKGHWTTVKSSK